MANEAFPSTPAKDFDRMLKGRFFQALHVRWQRKLEAPKPAESFKELYDRARIVEQHEKQYAAAAATRGETKHLGHSRRYRPPSDGTGAFPDKENRSSNTNQERICFICKQPGHIYLSLLSTQRQIWQGSFRSWPVHSSTFVLWTEPPWLFFPEQKSRKCNFSKCCNSIHVYIP